MEAIMGWWILLHIVLFAVWLGGDLGVYYASRFVLRPDLSPEARSTAAQIMNGMDQCPKVCLVLFLPSGVTLMAAERHGAELAGFALFTWWQAALVWVAASAWLVMTIADHHGRGPMIRRADWTLRIALATALVTIAAYTLLADRPFGVTTNPRWLGAKVALYALTIVCGLLIRVRLRPFGPAFAQLMKDGSTPQVERALHRSVKGCLPYVFAIWATLIVIAALGIIKPGAHSIP
jgi:hypothetical protein